MTFHSLPGERSSSLILAAVAALALSGCGGSSSDSDSPSDIDKPNKPSGTGSELTVAAPSVTYPLPASRYSENNADDTLRWVIGDNPVARLLSGINDIWKGTSDSYQSAASGSGPDSYLANPIINAEVWAANMRYVINVTHERSDEQAILAFLDDSRSKNYSVIDGYGPLTETYVENSGAYVDIPVPTITQVLEDEHYQPGSNDNIVFAGDQSSTLGEVVTLVDAFRQRSPASTNASKYIFSTPRPWRMTDNGEIDFLGTVKDYTCVDSAGNSEVRTVDSYTTSVKVVPGLMCARRAHSSGDHDKGLYTEDTENRRKDGGYPSGHTNAGYLAAMAYAYALPQRYSEMLTRASQLGESRIMAGMHSPLDVIGGRVQSMIVASYALNQPAILDQATAAYQRTQQFFGDLAEAEGMDLYQYAHRPVTDQAGLIDGANVRTEVYDNNLYDDHEANKEAYRFRMTYGLPRDPGKAGQDPIVPEGAEVLLATRLPYLTDEQRRAVLYTTSIDSGYPVLDATNGWGRLDLVTAADGYGAFLGDVSVTMDAGLGGFNARDAWRNDISGAGRLRKDGDGYLALTGENTYSGGTLVEDGTLAALSPSAFGVGDVYVEEGMVLVDVDGALAISGNLTVDGGGLMLRMDDDESQLTVGKTIYVDGGNLVLDFQALAPQSGETFTLLSGAAVAGTFDAVDAGDVAVELVYTPTSVVATIQ